MLSNACFVLQGFSTTKKKELTTLITTNGGTTAFTLSNHVSHLVVSEDEIKKPNNKLKEASKFDIEVITENDLQEYITHTQLNLNNNVQLEPHKDDIVVSKVVPQTPTKVAPTVNMLIPESGPTTGEYKVAIFGLNFVPGVNLTIHFGKIVPKHIEYHSPTCVAVTLEVQNVPAGEVPVLASNNGGKHFGPSCFFKFTGPSSYLSIPNQATAIAALQDKLQNVYRSIEQLQHGLYNVETHEKQIYEELSQLSSTPLPPLHPHSMALVPVHTTPTSAPSTPTKSILQIKPSSSRSPAKTSISKSPSKLKPFSNKANRLQERDKENQPPNVTHVDHPQHSLSESEKEIRIFISSTFKDMSAEREVLVKRIIPQLKRTCSDRDVVLSYVDFRWGVTESQSEQAQTMLLCLREIQRCNVFIGFYGARYGRCVHNQAVFQLAPEDELLKRAMEVAAVEFPWITQYKDRSMTEIEMRMILHNKYSGPKKKAWFYLRDPYYAETLSPDQKKLFASEGPEEANRLNSLKADIAASEYPSHQYNRPANLEDIILEDLQGYIDQKYPKVSQVSSLDSERMRHSAFSRALCRVYQPIEEYFLQLDKHADSNTGIPLVVLGESGLGKSALLANWATRFQQHHTEALLISHFVGCSPESSNYGRLVLRVMRELLAKVHDDKTNIPSDPKKAIAEFPRFLEETLAKNKRKKLVLIIDGLNNLDDRENALDLIWLPQMFAKNVCVVLSLAPGKVADVLQRRNYPMLKLKLMEEAQRKALIREMLLVTSKKLSAKHEFQIASYAQCGNPRFLRVLLDDIVVWGQFEELDAKIQRDLTANTTSELYELMLERLEGDYGQEVVKSMFSYLSCSRRGLYLDTELAPLLSKKNIESKALSSILVVVEDLLFNSLGLLGFSNRDIARAVESRYLKNEADKIAVHKQLAELFQSMEGYPERKIEEWCWQLHKAREYQRLRESVTNLSVFDILYTRAQTHKFDLLQYWRTLETQQKIDVVAEYKDSLERRSQFPNGVIVGDLFFRVASFLEDMGKYAGAEYVFNKARDHFELSAQNIEVAGCDYSLGRVLLSQARYAECEKVLKKALAIYESEKGPQDVDVAQVMMRLGQLYTELSRLKEAEAAFERSLNIRIQKLGSTDVRVGQTLKHMLSLYEGQGNLNKVLEIGAHALSIMEAQLGPDDLSVGAILSQLGRVFARLKNYKEAETNLQRALQIVTVKLGPAHPHTADHLYELGSLYFEKPEEISSNKENQNEWSKDKANEYFLTALKIKETSLGPNHPDVARIAMRLGSLHIERVQYSIAEQYLLRSYEIRKQKLGPFHARTGQTLKHMMTLYQSQENVPKAIEVGLEAKKVYEKNGESLVVSNILVRLSELYSITEGRQSSLVHQSLKKALEIKESLLGADHSEVKEINTLITNLSISTVKNVTVAPVLETPKEKLLKDCIVDNARAALLADIRKFGQTRKLQDHKSKVKKAVDSADWWKQNYSSKQK